MAHKSVDLPLASFSLSQAGSYAVSRSWQVDLVLPGERPCKFFGMAIFNDGPAENQDLIAELIQRLQDTIRYHHQVMLSHEVSLTGEDFFEQCLQKVNAEINVFLRDIQSPLPVLSWAITVGMLMADQVPHRWQIHLSRFGEINAWLVHKAQLDTHKLISIFDTPDPITGVPGAQKYFKNIVTSSVSDQDQILLCSPNVFNYISLSDVKRILTELSAPASMKQLQNSIQEHIVDAIACATTIKLSPYKQRIAMANEPASSNEAAQSMSNLIQTQSQTEQLLGTGSPLGLASAWSGLKRATQKAMPGKAKRALAPLTPLVAKVAAAAKTALNAIRSKAGGKSPLGKNEYVALHGTVAKISPLKAAARRIFGNIGWKSVVSSPRFYIATAIVIVVAVVGMRIKNNRAEYAAAVANAQTHIDTARATLDRIDSYLIVGREADAVALVQQVDSVLSLVPPEMEMFNEEKESFATKLADQQRRLRKEIKVQTPTILLQDLAPKLNGTPISLEKVDDVIYVFGADPHAFIAYDVPGNTGEERDIATDIGSINAAVVASPTLAVLAAGNTLTSIDPKKTGPEATATTTANTTSPLAALTAYNNRVYAVVPADQQILRSNTLPNFSVFSPWLKQPLPTLGLGRDIAVDGTIYVLTADGLLQFNQGTPVTGFKLDAVDPALSDAQAMSYTSENQHFFVLEGQRLLVYKKNGKFVSQYLFGGGSAGVDLFVDEAKSLAYVLTTSQLISFPIQL